MAVWRERWNQAAPWVAVVGGLTCLAAGYVRGLPVVMLVGGLACAAVALGYLTSR